MAANRRTTPQSSGPAPLPPDLAALAELFEHLPEGTFSVRGRPAAAKPLSALVAELTKA